MDASCSRVAVLLAPTGSRLSMILRPNSSYLKATQAPCHSFRSIGPDIAPGTLGFSMPTPWRLCLRYRSAEPGIVHHGLSRTGEPAEKTARSRPREPSAPIRLAITGFGFTPVEIFLTPLPY